MKKILLVSVLLFTGGIINAQLLDTGNYYIDFYDDFDYPVPVGSDGATLMASTAVASSGTVSGHRFSDNWFVTNGDWVGGNTYYYPANLTMSSPGIISLTESILLDSFNVCNGTGGYPSGYHDHTCSCPGYHASRSGGFLNTIQAFGYGIIEARIKFPHHNVLDTTRGPSAMAFWTCCGLNELDIFDGAKYGDWIPHRVIDEARNAAASNNNYTVSNDTKSDILMPLGIENLDGDFHIYSALWTPTEVSFYIDRKFLASIPYTEVRTYPARYALQLANLVINTNADMETGFVDWVKVWKQKCYTGTTNLPDFVFPSTFIIIPDLYKQEFIESSSTSLISTDSLNATILESPSTIIQSNFVADESVPLLGIHPPPTTPGNFQSGDSIYAYIPIYSNGFLEILPINCINGPEGTGYRVASNNNDKNPPNSLNSINKSVVSNNWHGYAQMGIYPNPTQNDITISYPCKSAGQLAISIKDVAGRIRYTESVICAEGNNIQHTVDLSSFSPGVYFVDLTLNEQHAVKKIVKL